MIRQVSMMTEQMFKGYFLLNVIRCREKKTKDNEVSLAQSKFNLAMRFHLLSSNTQIESMASCTFHLSLLIDVSSHFI
jgi:hypothetical protein